jgi:fatty acid/phospholipid biosynthesis enzyme
MLRLIRGQGLHESYEQRPIGSMILKGLRNELKMAGYRLNPSPSTRFVIFAQGRTGSTLLTSTLDTHPQITCNDEIRSDKSISDAVRRKRGASEQSTLLRLSCKNLSADNLAAR